MSRDRTAIGGRCCVVVGALLAVGAGHGPVGAASKPGGVPIRCSAPCSRWGTCRAASSGGGSKEGSDFAYDADAFAANGGERVVSQVWTSPDAGVVFDFRFAFPTETAAVDYLLAAMPALSEEAASGLTLAGDGLVGADDVFHWAGEASRWRHHHRLRQLGVPGGTDGRQGVRGRHRATGRCRGGDRI